MKIQRFSLFKVLITAIISSGGIVLLPVSKAIAAPQLTITPISWNILGLDSNKVTDGPDVFMVGARVCNTGDTAATNVRATFLRDGATNLNINLQNASIISIPSLPAGSTSASQTRPPTSYGPIPSNCKDFYYNVVITRTSAAYNTTQQYHIEAVADNAAMVRTPTNRELYVERLVSQNRNSVYSITGPATVVVGQTYQYTVRGKTATGGYEQLVFSPNFPNTIFQVLGVSANYTSPSGATNNSVYADACGWTNDITSSSYHNNLECTDSSIPDGYSGGKAGNEVSTTYTVKILSAGTATITNLIYDFSGSSYHYNSDFGTGINATSITAQNPSSGPDLEISKTHPGNFSLNVNGQYDLTVRNVGLSSTTGTITVTDTLPAGLNYVSAGGTGWTCAFVSATRLVTCTTSATLAASATSNPITLTVTPTTASSFINSATVTTPGDLNSGNNTANDPTTVNTPVNLSITKTDGLTSIKPGDAITYTITVTNNSSNAVTNASVTDSVPAIITGTSGTGSISWTCSITNGGSGSGSNSCGAASGTGNDIDTTVTLKRGAVATFTITGKLSSTAGVTSLSNTAYVTPPTGSADTIPADNTAIDTDEILIPDLTITKTHTGNFTQGQTGATYTITATNSGTVVTSGTVTVTDTLPPQLIPTAASGTGWNCNISGQTITCNRSNALPKLSSYPAITVKANVVINAPTSITNTATVSGGGQNNTDNDSASDPTTISSTPTTNPFSCDGNLYQIRVEGSGSQLFRINRNNTPYTQTQIGNITPAFTLNALGYNKLDGYMYALQINTNYLYRIDQNGASFVGVVTNLPSLNYNTATFDSAGNYYVKQDGSTTTIYKINVSTFPPTATTITLTQAIDLGDMAFHPTNDSANVSYQSIYGLRNSTLYKIKLSGTTGTVTTIGSTNLASSAAVGSAFFDPSGSLYAYENGGTFYIVNISTGAATQLSVAPSTTQSDGASCAFAAPERVINVTKSVNAVSSMNSTTFNVPYTVVVANAGTDSAPNTQVTENLNLTFSTGSPALTIVSAPAVTNGSCTANASFDGTTDTKLLASNNTLTSGTSGTCTIKFTVQVAYPSQASVPTTAQANTVYASSTTNSPNPGYTFNNGTPVPPPVLLSSAQSSISVTYPTTNSPNLLLVKRMTAINDVPVNGFQDGVASPTTDPNYVGSRAIDDNNSFWPLQNSYSLRGAINSSTITPKVDLKPGDVIEYTIYFLNVGGSNANSVSICDYVPGNMTFVPTGFNNQSISADAGGLPGTDYGIALGLYNSMSLPLSSSLSPNYRLTNVKDGDRGMFYTSEFPSSCTGTNTGRGAVVVNVGTIPNATAAGTPANSYGFIRFKAKVN